MIKSVNITLSMARMAERQQERFRGLQIIIILMTQDGMSARWMPIIKVYVSMSPKQLKPEHRPYIFVAFNFILGHE